MRCKDKSRTRFVAICPHCGAKKWAAESPGLCCGNGRVVLPALEPLPPLLDDLLHRRHPLSRIFLQDTRLYNAALNLASISVRSEKMFPTGLQAFHSEVHREGVPR